MVSESWLSELISRKQRLSDRSDFLISVQSQLESRILKSALPRIIVPSSPRKTEESELSASHHQRQLTQTEAAGLIRDSGLFDADYYRARCLKDGNSPLEPLEHYLLFSTSPGHDPHPLFDTSFYIEQNPEIISLNMNPLVHYLTIGFKHKRDPHPLFNTDYYLAQMSDRGLAPLNPLVHFIKGGADTGFNPHPLFDNNYYRQRYLEPVNSSSNSLLHYLDATVNSWPDTFPPLEIEKEIFQLNYDLPEFNNPPDREEIPKSTDPEYQQWLNKYYPGISALELMKIKADTLPYRPVFSLILAILNPDGNLLREGINSVLSQVYPHWELCIALNCSPEDYIHQILAEYSSQNPQIKVVYREAYGDRTILYNSALEIAGGDFVALLPPNVLLTPHALYEIAVVLNSHPEADMIYSDEDRIDENGNLSHPFFKPDWSPDLFLSFMYTGYLGIYRKNLIDEIGGFRKAFEGGEEYDLLLRLTEKTGKIFHVPNILCHRKTYDHNSSPETVQDAYLAGKKALEETISRRGEEGVVIQGDDRQYYQVRYFIKEYDLVSIIIPTKNLGTLLDNCLASVFNKTLYPNFEVILIDNGTTDAYSLGVIEKWERKETDRVRRFVVDVAFNYSYLNNFAVSQARGKYLLFLNNDTEVVTPDWLDAMVEQAQRSTIGAVGALLLYQDDTIQHAGVLGGTLGSAGHAHKDFPYGHAGYFNRLKTMNNYAAVTAACLMCRREVFEEIGGFEERLAVSFNDVDLCFKIIEKGYYNVWLPHVILYHYESKSRGDDIISRNKRARLMCEAKYLQKRWKRLLRNDPFYNRNLTLRKVDFSINLEPMFFE